MTIEVICACSPAVWCTAQLSLCGSGDSLFTTVGTDRKLTRNAGEYIAGMSNRPDVGHTDNKSDKSESQTVLKTEF